MQVRTDAFSNKERIPQKYVMPGAGGENVSIPVSWSSGPQEVKSFALSIIDPHPVANNWIHWLVINIPADVTSLAEGASGTNMPSAATELKNSFGKMGYGGPQPPKGTGEHPYVVTVYALSVPQLELSSDASLEEFHRAIEGKILDQAEVTGMYEQE
jgi:hypothetical protein